MALPIALGIAAGVGALGQIGTGLWASSKAKDQQRKAEERERRARAEMNRQKRIFASLDTSNPYLNLENKFEDLTINQKASEFQAQQFAQSQSNILDSMRGAAGGSGIAALAQSLSQQGQLASQKSAADIARQEAENQMKERQAASNIQTLERKGEIQSRNWERDKHSTLLGMAQQETASYMQQAQEAQTRRAEAIGGMFSGIMDTTQSVLDSGVFGEGSFA